jgi:hypothetical protein
MLSRDKKDNSYTLRAEILKQQEYIFNERNSALMCSDSEPICQLDTRRSNVCQLRFRPQLIDEARA